MTTPQMTEIDETTGPIPSVQEDKPAGHTPGPWGWFGNEAGIYLATPDRGRTYVMGFRRHGLQGAQPTFRVGGIMRRASDLVRFAVGDGVAKGFSEARADRSVYRYDISAVDHPDARLIASAPDLLAFAVALDADWTKEFPDGPDTDFSKRLISLSPETVALWKQCRAAISQALTSMVSE